MQQRNQPPTKYLCLIHLSRLWSSNLLSNLKNYVNYVLIFLLLHQVFDFYQTDPALFILYSVNSTQKPSEVHVFCSVAHTLTPPLRRLATFQSLRASDWFAVRVRQSWGGRDSNNPLVFPSLWTERHGRPRPGQTAERPRQHPLSSQKDASVSARFGR